jgi:hypothetical protein
MIFSVCEFHIHKMGNRPGDYEDSFAFHNQTRKFAIADGAAEADFAKRWADLLTTSFVDGFNLVGIKSRNELKKAVAEWLKPLQKYWFESVNWSQLPWFAQYKIEQQGGAYSYATFLGLEMGPEYSESGETNWRAMVVGDSVLFQVRRGKLRISFPIKHSNQFDSTPTLMFSDPVKNVGSLDHLKTVCNGECEIGDTFFLCTDAMAKWFLQTTENGGEPWQILGNLSKNDEFVSLIEGFRQTKAIRNDDTTVMIIKAIEQNSNKISGEV